MNIGDSVVLAVYSELCCDLCGEIIHNHIDCPVCNREYASTNNYTDLSYDGENVVCGCGAEFKLIGLGWYIDPRCELVSINTKGTKFIIG